MATLKAWDLVDGDLDFSSGRLGMAEDSNAIKTALIMRLDTRQNTFFLNLDFGLDYSAILGKPQVDTEMDAEFKLGILETPGVLELTQYRLNLDSSRVLSLNAAVRTIFSEQININL